MRGCTRCQGHHLLSHVPPPPRPLGVWPGEVLQRGRSPYWATERLALGFQMDVHCVAASWHQVFLVTWAKHPCQSYNSFLYLGPHCQRPGSRYSLICSGTLTLSPGGKPITFPFHPPTPLEGRVGQVEKCQSFLFASKVLPHFLRAAFFGLLIFGLRVRGIPLHG